MVHPLVSIITINRNNAIGLKKTIESVISQTYKYIEYIVIDGASEDESVNIIKTFEDKINYWVSEPDAGIYNAMNKGIRVAKGKYCQFLNSGDWLVDKHVTEKMLEDADRAGIIYGNLIKQITPKKTLYNRKIKLNSFYNFFIGTLYHATSYIPKDLFDKYGLYDEGLKVVSDWKFFLIAVGLNNEPVTYKNIDVTYFNMEGISNNNPTLGKEEREKVLKEVLPINIYNDYKQYSKSIAYSIRARRYHLGKLHWFVERVLFQIEKLETRLKKEHILN